MKRIFSLILMAAVSVSCVFGQAEINFANFASGLNAPVTLFGVPLSGTAWAADLFYGTTTGNNNLNLSQLTDAGLAATFQTGAGAGYFLGGSHTLPEFGNMEFEVVIWQTAAGATWAAATGGGAGSVATYAGNGGTQWGFSAPITFTPNIAPAGVGNLTGLQAFDIGFPEPAPWAIGAVGAAVLLLFRQRQ